MMQQDNGTTTVHNNTDCDHNPVMFFSHILSLSLLASASEQDHLILSLSSLRMWANAERPEKQTWDK